MKKLDRERIQSVLFGMSRETRCNFVNLSEDTGIPESTLRRYAKEPEKLTIERLLVIVKAMGLSPQEAGYLITGKR